MELSNAMSDVAEKAVKLLDIGEIVLNVPRELDPKIADVFNSETKELFRINQIIHSIDCLIFRASDAQVAATLHFCHGVFPDKNPSLTLLGLMVIYFYARLPDGIRASDLLRLVGDC
ncbi:MAG: hypothetical protein PHE24_03005 [Patescibacteria group bacterium]|nr:hypothetical protein [Patescibacteria group bacterium]